jgi:hypothetical protein
MTPDYALLQLLKLEPLNRDDIIKYTGWSEEKTTRTIEICLFNGKIAWKHKPSRYELSAVRESQGSAIKQRAQPKVHKLWGVWYPLHTEIRDRGIGCKTITTEGLA